MRPAIHVVKECYSCVDIEIEDTDPQAGKKKQRRFIYTTTTLKDTCEEEMLYIADLSEEIDGKWCGERYVSLYLYLYYLFALGYIGSQSIQDMLNADRERGPRPRGLFESYPTDFRPTKPNELHCVYKLLTDYFDPA